MTDRLAGKVAIITGASTGLGPVMAARFVAEGAKVLLAARREELAAAAQLDIASDIELGLGRVGPDPNIAGAPNSHFLSSAASTGRSQEQGVDVAGRRLPLYPHSPNIGGKGGIPRHEIHRL